MAPEVRDATSVAASQVAWTGDPHAPPHRPCSFGSGLVCPDGAFILLCEEAPKPPDLYALIGLTDLDDPETVLNINRDNYQCFQDEEYAKFPEKGPLYTFFNSYVVYPPARPYCPRAPLAPERMLLDPLDYSVVLPLLAWGGGEQPCGF